MDRMVTSLQYGNYLHPTNYSNIPWYRSASSPFVSVVFYFLGNDLFRIFSYCCCCGFRLLYFARLHAHSTRSNGGENKNKVQNPSRNFEFVRNKKEDTHRKFMNDHHQYQKSRKFSSFEYDCSSYFGSNVVISMNLHANKKGSKNSYHREFVCNSNAFRKITGLEQTRCVVRANSLYVKLDFRVASSLNKLNSEFQDKIRSIEHQ